MKGAATAALVLGVVLPMTLACAFPGQDGGATARQHGPETRLLQRPSTELLPLIVTAAPVYDSSAALRGAERFPKGAQLMVLRGGRMEPLAPDFAASADGNVSFDGRTVLFAGKRFADSPWQIWEAPAAGGTPRLVYEGHGDAIRPLWLPDGRVVFAERGVRGFGLWSVPAGGGAALRLTYLPGNFIADDVLEDGRVLFESGFPLGQGATPEMFLVYPDGSGVESVRCDHGNAEKSGGREHGRQISRGSAGASDIIFTQAGRLGRFTSALANEAPVAAPAGDFAGDVAALPDGRWVLALRRAGQRHDELAVWKSGDKGLRTIAQDAARDLVEPMVVAPRLTPHTFPSALHPWTSGNLLALDARLSRGGLVQGLPAMVRVETRAPTGEPRVLGSAPVMEDGSFFVKVPGDAPLRLILLDAAGSTIREEHGWFWMRSGEQRICVGCHTGPERAPDNRVPAILMRTTTPVDLSDAAAAAAGGGH